jgi:hypothetical protein
MDENFKKKLILIAVISGVILVLYYIMSPYQNCIREFKRTGSTHYVWCSAKTSW